MNMKQRLTRRRFGQLVIVGSAASGIGYFATRTSAQTAVPPTRLPSVSSPLIAVTFRRPSMAPTSTVSAPNVSGLTADVESGDAPPTNLTPTVSAPATNPPPVLNKQTLDFTTDVDLPRAQLQGSKAPLVETQTMTPSTGGLEPYRRLSGLTSLPGGTIILSTNPTLARELGNPTRLTTVNDNSANTVTVSGLDKQSALESLLFTNEGSLIGLVGKENGLPPYRLANIDANTGQLNFINVTLPNDELFGNLTQCPNGNIYLSTTSQGVTSLAQLDLQRGNLIGLQKLSFNNRVFENALKSLACSPTGQLFALATPERYNPTSYLFLVNVDTGVMTQLRELDVTKITFNRPVGV